MNEEMRRKFLGVMAFLTAWVLVWWVFTTLADSAEVVGNKEVTAGTLATFESDVAGDWLVLPEKGVPTFAKDCDGKRIFFASPEIGEFTVIFCAVEDGKPTIAVWGFTNGKMKPEPEPEPEPEPDGLTEVEKGAVVWAVESVLQHVENGSLRTPQGMRATFKQALVTRLGTVSETLNGKLGEWTQTIDFSTVRTTSDGLKKILEGLK